MKHRVYVCYELDGTGLELHNTVSSVAIALRQSYGHSFKTTIVSASVVEEPKAPDTPHPQFP